MTTAQWIWAWVLYILFLWVFVIGIAGDHMEIRGWKSEDAAAATVLASIWFIALGVFVTTVLT